MAGRPRKNISINDEITKQEEAVAKAKERYDAEVAKLKDLLEKQDEIKKKELLSAVSKSKKSFDEIMAFLNSDDV